MHFDDNAWQFVGILLVIVLGHSEGRVGRIGTFWQILSTLPGTLLHELAHLLVALVTGGRPTGFSVIPHTKDCLTRDGTVRRRWTLGSVTIANPGMVSAFPTAMAPLFLNVAAWQLYCRWFSWFPRDPVHVLALYGTIYLFVSASVPSVQDLKIACSSLVGLALYGTLLVAAVAWWGGWLVA